MTQNNTPNRIKAYTETIEENHGLLQSSTAQQSIKADLNKHDRDFEPESPQTVDGTEWEVIKYDSQSVGTVYVAEHWSRVAIDDVLCTSYTFDHYPSADNIESVHLAQILRSKVEFNKIPREFDCWECGHHTHILDIGTNESDDTPRITEILRYAEDRYCNKC